MDFFLLFLILLSFYFISFFISQTTIYNNIIDERPQNLSSDRSNNFPSNNLKNSQEESFYLKTISDIKNDFILNSKSFLEVNLSAMKVRLYRDGGLLREVPILAKGDPQVWGGSALGVYKVLSRNEISFSIIANVYMPYALHYYGKYYIHGVPYYPGRQKRITTITGGCIQLSDKDAKDIYELTELDMPVLVIGKEKDYYQFTNKNLSEFPEVSAKSYLVADLDSGFVFAEKNSKEQLPLASLNKLMLALVVAENVDLRKSILVKPEMLEAYGSTKELEAGKSFRVVELFYPLLIESSNDAAEVLSGFLGRTKTIEMMNEKAKAILMENTQFVDSHGFDLKNVSTAQDLFQLGRYILDARPLLLEIAKGKIVRSFGEVRFNIQELWNKNVFSNNPNFVGGKTDYLAQSKNNALFIFKFLTEDGKNRNIVIILLGSDNTKIDTQKIYKWLLENYSLSSAFKD